MLDAGGGGGWGEGPTDFESYPHEALAAMISDARAPELAKAADALLNAKSTLETLTVGLESRIGRLEWTGPAADGFREWAGQVMVATRKFAEHSGLVGAAMEYSGSALSFAVATMPPVPVNAKAIVESSGEKRLASLADDRLMVESAKLELEKARLEAVRSMETLGSSYTINTETLVKAPDVVFPPLPALPALAREGGTGGGGNTHPVSGTTPAGVTGGVVVPDHALLNKTGVVDGVVVVGPSGVGGPNGYGGTNPTGDIGGSNGYGGVNPTGGVVGPSGSGVTGGLDGYTGPSDTDLQGSGPFRNDLPGGTTTTLPTAGGGTPNLPQGGQGYTGPMGTPYPSSHSRFGGPPTSNRGPLPQPTGGKAPLTSNPIGGGRGPGGPHQDPVSGGKPFARSPMGGGGGGGAPGGGPGGSTGTGGPRYTGRTGGVVGGTPSAAGGRGQFSSGGTGLAGRPAGTAGSDIGGRRGSMPMRGGMGASDQGEDNRGRRERADYLREDEETWTGGHRSAPPVVD